MSSSLFNTALFLDRLSRITPACVYALGLATAAKKVLLLPDWMTTNTLLGMTAAAWLIAVAADMTRQLRTPYSKEYAAAWLDWKNHAGGTILAGTMKTLLRTKPRLTFVPLIKSLVPPLLFFSATLLIPAMQRREAAAAASLRHRVEEAVEQMKERDERLAAPDQERFAQQLEAMNRLAETNPEATAEALANFEQRLAEAETMRMERAADVLEAAAAQADLGEAMEEMIRGEGGLDALPESLQSAWNNVNNGANSNSGGTNAAQNEQLQNALREWSEQLTGAAQSGNAGDNGNTGGSGEGNAKDGQSGSAASSAARDRLLSAGEALDALDSSLQPAGAPANGTGESFGSGGVGRGRADAPLMLGDPSERGDAEETTLHALPEGESGDTSTTLLRDRRSPTDPLPPEEFQETFRTANDAPASVNSGRAAGGFGPARARAVEEYFKAMNENANEGNAQWPTAQNP